MDFPIQLEPETGRASHRHVARAAAWLLPGGDAERWIEVLSQWPVDQARLELHVLGSPQDPDTPTALFVRTPSEIPAAAVPRAIPCHAIHGRLFLPRGARLRFPLLKEDLDALLPGGFALFHPVTGWTRFDEDTALHLDDLLFPPAVRPTAWDRALRGNPARPGLTGVEASLPRQLQRLLDRGRDGIGENGMDRIPRLGRENPAVNWARDLADAARRRVLRQFGRLGQGREKETTASGSADAGPGGWAARLQQWAAAGLARSSPRQDRQVERLLEMFRRDPEQALKFALPLGNHGALGRGLAAMGSLLLPRNVDFNLGDLFSGGGAAGAWHLGGDHYQQLQNAYREAANREMQLGRYRRAAYIFARLLGDYHAAADALRQGRHFAEAAVLYEKKLKDRRSAAQCYRDGALYRDAIRLYEDLGDYLELGRLYRQLGREEEAGAAFEESIRRLLQQDNPLEAARQLREELGDAERALGTLRQAWPESRQAVACLEEEFRLLAEWERHGEAAERVLGLRLSQGPPATLCRLVERFASLSQSYPADAVRESSADAARTLASRVLTSPALPEQRGAVLGILPRVAPEDLLLQRDCRRFAALESGAPRTPPPPPGFRGNEAVVIEPVDSIALPQGTRIHDAIPYREGLALCGTLRDQPHFFLLWPDHELETLPLDPEGSPRGNHRPIRLVPGCGGRFTLLHHRAYPEAASTDRAGNAYRVGTAAHLADSAGLAFDPSSGRHIQLSLAEGALVLRTYLEDELVSTRHLTNLPENFDPEWLGPEDGWIPMAAARGQLFLGLGPFLCRCEGDDGDDASWIELAGPIHQLALTSPHASLRVAAGLDSGGVVAWGDHHWKGHHVPFGSTHPTRSGFTRSGHLITVNDTGRIEARATDKLSLTACHALDPSPGRQTPLPIAILPADRPDSFWIVYPDAVRRYRLLRKQG